MENKCGISYSQEFPFFATAKIPLPDNIKDSEIGSCQKRFWSLAEQDFVNLSMADGYGDSIRNFFERHPEGGILTLKDISDCIGVTDSRVTRRVRSTLGLGTELPDSEIHNTLWTLSALEVAQIMVGSLAYVRSNFYNKIVNSHA